MSLKSEGKCFSLYTCNKQQSVNHLLKSDYVWDLWLCEPFSISSCFKWGFFCILSSLSNFQVCPCLLVFYFKARNVFVWNRLISQFHYTVFLLHTGTVITFGEKLTMHPNDSFLLLLHMWMCLEVMNVKWLLVIIKSIPVLLLLEPFNFQVHKLYKILN